MVIITPTFAQRSKNSSSWHLGDQTCNSPSNNCPHKSSIPQQEQARSETVVTRSQRHATLLSFSLTRKTLQGTSQQSFSSSRDGFRFGKTPCAAQGTRRTPAYRNTMLGNTTVDTRKTSVGGASGHEEQHCRSLHETSGWIANTFDEAWAANLGWYKWYEWNERG